MEPPAAINILDLIPEQHRVEDMPGQQLADRLRGRWRGPGRCCSRIRAVLGALKRAALIASANGFWACPTSGVWNAAETGSGMVLKPCSVSSFWARAMAGFDPAMTTWLFEFQLARVTSGVTLQRLADLLDIALDRHHGPGVEIRDPAGGPWPCRALWPACNNPRHSAPRRPTARSARQSCARRQNRAGSRLAGSSLYSPTLSAPIAGWACSVRVSASERASRSCASNTGRGYTRAESGSSPSCEEQLVQRAEHIADGREIHRQLAAHLQVLRALPGEERDHLALRVQPALAVINALGMFPGFVSCALAARLSTQICSAWRASSTVSATKPTRAERGRNGQIPAGLGEVGESSAPPISPLQALQRVPAGGQQLRRVRGGQQHRLRNRVEPVGAAAARLGTLPVPRGNWSRQNQTS